MRILHNLADLARTAPRVSLAAGTFDGVHRGHARVLRAAVARARTLGGEAWALTFDPHPLSVLDPSRAPALLTPPDLRNTFLEKTGLDGVVVLPFTPELAALSPEEFVRHHLLHGDWAPEVVFAGDNWRFGAKGAGRLGDIPALSGGRIRVRLVPALLDGGEPVSSTRIRTALANGDINVAARLLGRPYLLRGTVEHGRGVGRSLDAATANLVPLPGSAIPKPGVYAGYARGPFPGDLDAVVNIGVRPTFHDAESGQQTIEAHIIGFSGDLYGKSLELELWSRLRDERAFDSPEELAAQKQKTLPQDDQVGVIAYVAGGRAEVDDPGRLRALQPVGVDVAHHVVPHLPLPRFGLFVVDVVLVGSQLPDLFFADRQAELRFGFRQRDPKPPPGAEFLLLGKKMLHLAARVAAGERAYIRITGHERTPLTVFSYR